MQASLLAGAPTPFTGHDFEFAASSGSDNKGLQQAPFFERCSQRVQLVFIKMLAGIVRVGLQQFDGHVAQRTNVLNHRFFVGVVTNQSSEPASQSTLLCLCHEYMPLLFVS